MKLMIAAMTLIATSAFAQTPACDGNITMVRVSAIKAGGTMKNFVAAVDAQRAWYRANGVTDNQLFVARVIPVARRLFQKRTYLVTTSIPHRQTAFPTAAIQHGKRS